MVHVGREHFLIRSLEQEGQLALVAADDQQVRQAVLDHQAALEAALAHHAAALAGGEQLLHLALGERLADGRQLGGARTRLLAARAARPAPCRPRTWRALARFGCAGRAFAGRAFSPWRVGAPVGALGCAGCFAAALAGLGRGCLRAALFVAAFTSLAAALATLADAFFRSPRRASFFREPGFVGAGLGLGLDASPRGCGGAHQRRGPRQAVNRQARLKILTNSASSRATQSAIVPSMPAAARPRRPSARILHDLAAAAGELGARSRRRSAGLCADVLARRTLPPWDNSAMDGYAVRSADLAARCRCACRWSETIHAGDHADRERCGPGEAARGS